MSLNTPHEANVATRSRRQLQALANALEHGDVRVRAGLVAGDLVVVGLAEQNLGIAGIREPMAVGQPHRAAEARLPATEPCSVISVSQKNGISFLRRASADAAQKRR